jgi:tetratricopeptide (TPR) repeat protein
MRRLGDLGHMADQTAVTPARRRFQNVFLEGVPMSDGVRGDSISTRRYRIFILLMLGFATLFSGHALAASPESPFPQPIMADSRPMTEEQILSPIDKITKPVDNDAEAMRHNDLGVAFVFKGDLGQAIDEFKHALRLQANYFAAHLNLANTLLDIGKHDDAIAEFKAALVLQPDDLKAHNDLGVALKEMGDLGGAIVEFKTVLRHRPHDVNAHNNLGVALKAMGDVDGAIAEYRTAASLQPNDINARFNLGLALMEKGNPEAAIEEFRTALHLRPNDAKIRFNLGNALAGIGRRMEAAQELRQYLRLELDTPANRRWLEQAEAKLRELEMPQ